MKALILSDRSESRKPINSYIARGHKQFSFSSALIRSFQNCGFVLKLMIVFFLFDRATGLILFVSLCCVLWCFYRVDLKSRLTRHLLQISWRLFKITI